MAAASGVSSSLRASGAAKAPAIFERRGKPRWLSAALLDRAGQARDLIQRETLAPRGLWRRPQPVSARGYPPVVGVLTSKLDRGYLPCPGRPVVCRRDGCREAATDAVMQLCAGHLAGYQAERTRVGPAAATESPRRHQRR